MAKDNYTITILTVPEGKPIEVLFKDLADVTLKGTARGILKCMDAVAIQAVGKHMIKTHGAVEAGKAPIHPTMVTIRSGRLASSILNNYRFTVANTFKGLKAGALTNYTDIGGAKEGYRRIDYQRAKGIIGIMGTDVPYAAIHEYGRRPYLEPALRDKQNQFGDIIEKELGAILTETRWAPGT